MSWFPVVEATGMLVGVHGTGVQALALHWMQQGMSLAALHAAGCLVLLWYRHSSVFLSLFFHSYVWRTVALMLLVLGRALGMPEMSSLAGIGCAGITTFLSLTARSCRAKSSTQTPLKGTQTRWLSGMVDTQASSPVRSLHCQPTHRCFGSPAWWHFLDVGWSGEVGRGPGSRSHTRLSGVVFLKPLLMWLLGCGADFDARVSFPFLLLPVAAELPASPCLLQQRWSWQKQLPRAFADPCPQPWDCSFWRSCMRRRRRRRRGPAG